MDQKVSRQSFKAYKRWQKYILGTYPKLPKGRTRVTLIAYCLAMASHGSNGLDCFASDETIGKEIGIANRSVVAKYRHLAVELSWFAPNGKRHGRAEDLDIRIPSEDVAHPPVAAVSEVPSVEQASVTDAKDDWDSSWLEA